MRKDFPVCRSMVVACDTEKVVICAYIVQNIIVVAPIGSIVIIILTYSTSVKVERCHLLIFVISPDFSFFLIAALSRKLQIKKNCNN
ncbi:hypothetical protein Hdeb2414_s0003g00095751 [Helianthus debilis subsp. tardiflorus]